MKSDYKIAVAGLWHLGETYSAGLAELGHRVFGITEDQMSADNFMKFQPPLAEPGLEELLRENISAGRLSYSADYSSVSDANVFWVTFDTPVNENDDVDLSVVFDAFEKAIPFFKDGVLAVVTSQLPVSTSEKLIKMIKERRPELNFGYVYTPENLRLGEAVKCFMEPGRVVVGADSVESLSKIKEIFSPLKAEILEMSPASAEMAKHALNGFLATSLSFINDIADVCEKTGADVLDVIKALKSDPRIGQKAYLDASLGFSGGTLGRDLKALSHFAKSTGISLPVIENVYSKNLARKNWVIEKLKSEIGVLNGARIAILGLTYKAGTSTLRRSQALEVASDLNKVGAVLFLTDPKAEREDILRDPYQAAKGVKAVVLMTPWPDYKNLDFKKLAEVCGGNPLFLDTRNFLYQKEGEIVEAGFKYKGIGR